MSDCGCVENNLNFSPRIGLAYQATPKTVIRSGFGTYYGEPSYENQDGARFYDQPPSLYRNQFPHRPAVFAGIDCVTRIPYGTGSSHHAPAKLFHQYGAGE